MDFIEELETTKLCKSCCHEYGDEKKECPKCGSTVCHTVQELYEDLEYDND